MKKFLDGFRPGVEYFYEPANADEVIGILQAEIQKSWPIVREANLNQSDLNRVQ